MLFLLERYAFFVRKLIFCCMWANRGVDVGEQEGWSNLGSLPCLMWESERGGQIAGVSTAWCKRVRGVVKSWESPLPDVREQEWWSNRGSLPCLMWESGRGGQITGVSPCLMWERWQVCIMYVSTPKDPHRHDIIILVAQRSVHSLNVRVLSSKNGQVCQMSRQYQAMGCKQHQSPISHYHANAWQRMSHTFSVYSCPRCDWYIYIEMLHQAKHNHVDICQKALQIVWSCLHRMYAMNKHRTRRPLCPFW